MTKVLNLDEIVEDVAFELVLKGEKHPIKSASVETFLANMADLESLGMDAGPVKELKVMMDITLRAFPTLKMADLQSLTLPQIKKIAEFSQEANGEKVTTEGEAPSEGNEMAAK